MILITGGTGLVGSRLIYDYAQQGIKVRAIRRSNSIGNLQHYSGWENFVEWSNVPDSKSGVRYPRTEGSNPSLSALS